MLNPQEIYDIPEDTQRVAQAAFPRVTAHVIVKNCKLAEISSVTEKPVNSGYDETTDS